MNIAIVTGSRAEWGLVAPLATELGAVKIDVSCWRNDMTHIERMQEAMRVIQVKSRWEFDYAILAGDRYEMVAAGIALNMLKVPCVHIFGGYVTEGSQDDAWRHCLTKLSQLHFVENEECRQRVIQLGEHPDTVHNVGMIGCDFSDIEADSTYDYIVIYHPETLGETDVMPLKEAMHGKLCLWFTPNNDPDTFVMNGYQGEFWAITDNLPRRQFLSYLKGAKAIVGNSSAGIREAPAMGTPCVNIGDRQKGRWINRVGVVSCDNNAESIISHLKQAEKEGQFISGYNEDGTDKIVEILKAWTPHIRKGFYDK